MSNTWTPRSWDEAVLRAAGRRRYNRVRQVQAELRRHEVVQFWAKHRGTPGWQAKAARELGVHRSTVCRDVQTLLRRIQTAEQCPLCGHWA